MDGTTPIAAERKHTFMGLSSAERWGECPGSVALSRALQDAGALETDAPEYQRDGTTAHAAGAQCLIATVDCWEVMADFPDVSAQMADGVQSYVDYCRSISQFGGARKYVEMDVGVAEFHEHARARLDFVVIDPAGPGTEIVDYKNGVGVVVEVERNWQLMGYGFYLLDGDNWPDDLERLSDEHPVKLTICQPNGFHPDGAIRSWQTTAGEIRRWAYAELQGAMQRAGEHTFHLGEHCRFCPAKLVCPAMRHLATDAVLAHQARDDNGVVGYVLADTADEWLGQWYSRVPQLKMFVKALEDEAERRLLAGKEVPNAKLVYGIARREWKPEATDALVSKFGDQAWMPRSLRSPNQLEELLGKPAAGAFIAEYVQKAQGKLVVAPIGDKRAAQKPQTAEEKFAGIAA